MRDLTKGLETKQMMKCEGCGQYHPIEDCEVVIIKIIKGKQCGMPRENRDDSPIKSDPRPEIVPDFSPKETNTVFMKPIRTVDVMDQVTPDNENPVFRGVKQIIDGEEIVRVLPEHKVKSIVPPGISGMMIDPSNPDFETKGAKERRRV